MTIQFESEAIADDDFDDREGLPLGGSAVFPPEPFDLAQNAMGVWDAWYVGDTERLTSHYTASRAQARPSQYMGGVVGMAARFFWGRPSTQNTKRVHVPVPADLARTSADLLFSDPPRFVFGDEDDHGSESDGDDEAMPSDPNQQRLEELLGGPDAAATFLEAGELAAALGGVYLRMWWDEKISTKIEFSAVAADCAIPTWRYGKLIGVTFWTVVKRTKSGVWRHLERHEPGRILHGLYYGSDKQLGQQVPLTDHPATAWAAREVDEDGAISTDIEQLTACYVPNVLPNRMWRNTPGLAPLGRSDFDGLEPLFDALDEAVSSWQRDVELAKARIFVDKGMTKDLGPGKGSFFDSDQDVFVPIMQGGAAKDAQNMVMNQFDIRWQEHSQTVAEILNMILRGAGYSISNFSDSQLTVAMTATEVDSRDKMGERTRAKKIGYWRAALGPFAEALIRLDNEVFASGTSIERAPEVRFPVRSTESLQTLAPALGVLLTSGGISTQQTVRRLNPNWSGQDVNDEEKRIKDDMLVRAKLQAGMDPNGDTQPGEDFGGGFPGLDEGDRGGDQPTRQ